MDNYLTKLSKFEILLTNIGHGQNFDKQWTETGQNLDICQKIVQILSNLPFYRSTVLLYLILGSDLGYKRILSPSRALADLCSACLSEF